MYLDIIKEFQSKPRDVHTIPLNGQKYKWFHVFVNNGLLYVKSAENSFPKCSVKKRLLPEKEYENILIIYHRRQNGEKVSKEATEYTRSQVYWYGIFNELNM